MGAWDKDSTFTLQANKGDNVKINVALVDPFTNASGAKAGQGRGSWLYRMGTKETAASSVSLTIPGNISRVGAAYTTTLTWTLSDTAVE